MLVSVTLNCVTELVEEGLLNNAQMPPQSWAPFKAMVGATEILKDVAVGVGDAETWVFAVSTPVPEYTAKIVLKMGAMVPVGSVIAVPEVPWVNHCAASMPPWYISWGRYGGA